MPIPIRYAPILVTGLLAGAAHAQQRDPGIGFDSDRLWLADSTIFVPFEVTETIRLAEAVAGGTVLDDTPIVILDRGRARLALLTAQLAYHHIAQGVTNGEPWMVSF